ncbi:MAG TPA: methylenetetrahydrofolate reductase C-terminal domain-containing protein [bacterium]|nr:methylenetetrahydrofolate reductase C-terminal domain-containing protein [bacterium]HOQ81820.1 methylenetetrahydrofolate reductase C-terminal domain-containing protein [bacterium]
MLITKLKNQQELDRYFEKELFVFKCFGCKEVYFPEEEIGKLIIAKQSEVSGIAEVDYLCNDDFSKRYIEKSMNEIKGAQGIVVFSCGVGVQVIAKLLEDKTVFPGCDTHYLNGFQGLTVLDYDCNQCGECYLNYTGGICPITSCSKSLLNGPCGGAKNKKCEVSPEMDCGWVLIYERLKKINKESILKDKNTLVRDFEKIIKGI